MKIIQLLQQGCFAGLCALFLFFCLPIESIAAVNIPFDDSDAGFNLIPSGEDIVSEAAPDSGSNQLVNIMVTVFHTMKWVLGFLVFIVLVYAGVQMVATSTNEESYSKSVRMVLYSISGLVVMLLVEPFVLDIFYGGGSAGVSYLNTGINDIEESADNFRRQVTGLIQFFKTLLVFIAMAYVILSGVRMILAFGSDDALGSAKQMFLPIGLGLIVILFNEVFIDYILYDITFDGNRVGFTPDSSEANIFIDQLVGFIQYLLQFIALLVFGFLVYGGFLYIVSFGNEETADKGKKIFINSIIGMVILIFSYILMWSLVNFSITLV